MKKFTNMMLALLMSCTLVACSNNSAEKESDQATATPETKETATPGTKEESKADTKEETEETEKAAATADDYEGTWACGRASITITKTGNSEFTVNIVWGNTAAESTMYDYTGTYDEVTGGIATLETGVKSVVTFAEDGSEEERNVEFEDGAATFVINEDGKLIWNEFKENAGDGMEFELVK